MSSPPTSTESGKPRDRGKLGGLRRLRERLFEPVDIASIVVFRMMFGALMIYEVWRYFEYGWIRAYFIEPTFYFKYFGFGWIHPWPGEGMYIHFALFAVCALCVMAGLFYRLSSWLMFFGIAFWFLQDQATYLNHLYLIVLISFLMAVIPAHRAKSLDAFRKSNLCSDTVSAWCLWLLRAQVGFVYYFGGIAKLNSDWLRGEPVRGWLRDIHSYPVVGPWLDTEIVLWFMSYGGLFFDLAVVPALLWRKSRPWALAACVMFHIANACLFSIGVFPPMMMAATLLLLPPDWPRKVYLIFSPQPDKPRPVAPPPALLSSRQHLTEVFLLVYLMIQVFLPLRHFLYPGHLHWTEEGVRFAWHMMVRQKSGDTRFYAMDPSSGEIWTIDQRQYLRHHQYMDFGGQPDMCLQFASFLAAELKEKGRGEVEIHVLDNISLNGGDYQALIDPEVDLSKEPRTIWHVEWILPRKHPKPEPSP